MFFRIKKNACFSEEAGRSLNFDKTTGKTVYPIDILLKDLIPSPLDVFSRS